MAPRARLVSFRIAPTMILAAAGGFDLFWDAQSVGFTPDFMPQYSHIEGGPWTDLIETATPLYTVAAVGPKRLSFQEEFFFRLLVMDGAAVVLTSNPVQPAFIQNRHDYTIYREMLRREKLGLEKYHGEPGTLLRRIIYGTRCIDCADETLADPASNECATCYGTGFEDGYYPPFAMFADWADEPSAPNNTKLDPPGPSELRVCEAIFAAYPTLKFKDIYVEGATGHRHEVRSSVSDEFRGATIRQIVTLSRLPITDPAYQVPLS